MTTYLTTTIPYVNARPHLGHALEFVQADVLARHYRRHGEPVRLQAGTDDNSLKNVLAAEAAGVPVQEFVDRHADAFVALHGPLSLSVDDVIRTSRDPRHRVGVERFWQACADNGDLYRKHYEGLYCVGCESFVEGPCPEHDAEPQLVSEENWFFRLSRHAEALHGLIAGERLRILPAERRNEVLGFIAGGLEDFSISRSVERAHGWGIPVPGDPSQVIYVWWDALGNYLTALGYGTEGADLDRWWRQGGRRVHVAGKGVIRFHAVYWPAMLLSAGEAPPTDVLVHDYLTVDGRKISKSSGNAVGPAELIGVYGTDAVRWWLLREVPRVGDADFTAERLAARADGELANGLGNLVHRVVSMIHRYRGGRVPEARDGALDVVTRRAPELVDAALDGFDFRAATSAVWAIADAANRWINEVRPWALAKAGQDDRLDAVLGTLAEVCRTLGDELAPFLPDAAARIVRQCTPVGGVLPAPSPLFRRLLTG